MAELALVVECVTNRRLVARHESSSDSQIYAITFATPVSLRAADGGASGILLDIRQHVSVVPVLAASRGGWHIEHRMYTYALLDRNEEELLVYHGQPGPDYEGPDYPHLHVSAFLDAQVDALTRRKIDLDKLHIVTGQVTLQAIIRMLITEFQIRPLRPDWDARLSEATTH